MQVIAISTNWHRLLWVDSSYARGHIWLDAIPSGSTLRRVRWSWGFAGFTQTTTDLNAVGVNMLAAGLVTTIGDGTETPPSPLDTPGDVAPPTQRWLWWENRQPVCTSIDGTSDTASWRDSGPQEVPDVKAQVLATGIPGGDTLNLWFSWQSLTGAWDSFGSVNVWVSSAVLYSTP